MYKDKDKQREANRKAAKRYRDNWEDWRNEGMTNKGMTQESMTDVNEHTSVIPSKVIPERTAQGNIRVSKPGDADYEPQCETTRAFIEDRPKRRIEGKRGKDIKVFADLPADVQVAIITQSDTNEEQVKRTAIAIRYQHLFPDRYYNTGVA